MPWDPLNGTGDDFFGGHSHFLSVSNDFSGKKQDLKSVVHCPFKTNIFIVDYTFK